MKSGLLFLSFNQFVSFYVRRCWRMLAVILQLPSFIFPFGHRELWSCCLLICNRAYTEMSKIFEPLGRAPKSRSLPWTWAGLYVGTCRLDHILGVSS